MRCVWELGRISFFLESVLDRGPPMRHVFYFCLDPHVQQLKNQQLLLYFFKVSECPLSYTVGRKIFPASNPTDFRFHLPWTISVPPLDDGAGGRNGREHHCFLREARGSDQVFWVIVIEEERDPNFEELGISNIPGQRAVHLQNEKAPARAEAVEVWALEALEWRRLKEDEQGDHLFPSKKSVTSKRVATPNKARWPFRQLIFDFKIGVELSSLSQKNIETAIQKKILINRAAQRRLCKV